MIGRTLGHHRIVQKIGAGGMGEVYLAHDDHLERDVAVKVLGAAAPDEAARKRFRQEALALSRLNHPNIATVHEFGSDQGMDFLVMEFIPGVSLNDKLERGPLAEKEVVRLGSQLAEALAAAHDQGVVHRDLKPGNLRITADGRLKVLDFGLASLLKRHGDVDAATTETVEGLYRLAGTLPYMAPEQLRGEVADHRTDLWAVGVVLYEMATGRRPFDSRVATALAADIQNAPVVPPGRIGQVSLELQQIILKCLEKDPDHRYQSARDLLADFRRLAVGTSASAQLPPTTTKPRRTRLAIAIIALALIVAAGFAAAVLLNRRPERAASAGASGISSVAVLPMVNVSRDPAQEHLVDAMHEALITELSKIKALRVISRTSAVRYKGTEKTLAQIAGELNVQAVLEGSVLRDGNRLRVSAQLIEVSPERNLWADKFDRELTDILYLTSEVAQAVASRIRIALSPDEQAHLARARPVDPRAYELYALGRHYWSQRTVDSFTRAIDTFRKALEVDPGHAPTYAALADTYMLLGEQGGVPQSEARTHAAEAVRKALALDAELAEAHVSLAQWQFFYEWNWTEADKAFKRALELNPGYAAAHQHYGRFLAFMGRFEDALREVQRARELDPLSIILHAYTGQIHLFARQYDRAAEHLGAALQLNPDHALALHNLGELHLAQGRFREAVVPLERSVEVARQRNAHYLAILGFAYARSGRQPEADRILQELTGRAKHRLVSAFDMAVLNTAMGQQDRALAWLERGYEERDAWLVELKAWPWFDELADHPRFRAVERRMNFPR